MKLSTRGKLEKMVFDCGVFLDDAKKIVDLAIPEIESAVPDYQITWDRPSDEYPDVLYNMFFITVVKSVALRYIEENMPNAWYKAIFEN